MRAMMTLALFLSVFLAGMQVSASGGPSETVTPACSRTPYDGKAEAMPWADRASVASHAARRMPHAFLDLPLRNP